MTSRLVLTGQQNFDEITKFFNDAGPDARIRARKSGDVVELYVRDLSLKGRLQEWWNTNSDQRKAGYQSAKLKIESSILNNSNKTAKDSAEEHFRFASVFEAHKQDFVASEILGLQNQFSSRDEISSSLDMTFPLRTSLTVGKGAELTGPDQAAYNAMAEDLLNADPSQLVKVFKNLSGGKYASDELHQYLAEFKKFVALNSTKKNPQEEEIDIDLVAAKTCLIVIAEMKTQIGLVRERDDEQKFSKLKDDASILTEQTWNLLADWSEKLLETSTPKA